MVARSGQGQTWDDVELPYVVRYRMRGFIIHFLMGAALLGMAGICFVLFETLLSGALPAVMGVVVLGLTIVTWQHARKIDRLRIDAGALTLVAKDGGVVRIPFKPELEFSVVYEQCCRSIVVSAAGDHWDKRHIVADMLDVPPGLTIYGLCDLMNDLSRGYASGGAAGRSRTKTVRLQKDWYRQPTRISRLVFLAGTLVVGALFLCVLFALSIMTYRLGDWISKPIVYAIKFGLSVLFTYPAQRFLAVGRLRDLGENATHQNARGLIWNFSIGGPFRLFLRRGQEGRNEFGPEPRL